VRFQKPAVLAAIGLLAATATACGSDDDSDAADSTTTNAVAEGDFCEVVNGIWEQRGEKMTTQQGLALFDAVTNSAPADLTEEAARLAAMKQLWLSDKSEELLEYKAGFNGDITAVLDYTATECDLDLEEMYGGVVATTLEGQIFSGITATEANNMIKQQDPTAQTFPVIGDGSGTPVMDGTTTTAVDGAETTQTTVQGATTTTAAEAATSTTAAE